jgi:hypothetical protein
MASHTITIAATGLRLTRLPTRGSWARVSSIEPIAAMAATRLIRVTARNLPTRIRLRGVGVRRRLSRVFLSRSPAEVSSAAESPPVNTIVIRM